MLERDAVVAVDRADVLQPEVLEHALRREDVLEALLHAVQRLVDRGSDDRRATERGLAPVEDALVGVRGAQRREVVGQAADGRRVGPAVVVDHHDERTVRRRGDVVDGLPGHAAGERAVADDADDVALGELAGALEALRDAVGPRQRGRRVRVLDDVVLGLGAARVAGEVALLLAGARSPRGDRSASCGRRTGGRCRRRGRPAASGRPGAARWSARRRRGWARGGRRCAVTFSTSSARISSARAGSSSAGRARRSSGDLIPRSTVMPRV